MQDKVNKKAVDGFGQLVMWLLAWICGLAINGDREVSLFPDGYSYNDWFDYAKAVFNGIGMFLLPIYLFLGLWQGVSCAICALRTPRKERNLARRCYEIAVLLVLASLPLNGLGEIRESLFAHLWLAVLLFGTPLMAVFYTGLTFYEAGTFKTRDHAQP